MKKIIPLSFGFLALSLGTLAGFKHTHFEVAKAYDKASLPTTIDLNKVEENDVRSYYSGLNSLTDSEKTGTNLLKNLKPILSDNQKYYSYDISQGGDIWKMYEITDRDWEKSPASEIVGYNSSTNTITGYKYKQSGNDPYIHALYVNRDVDNQMTAWKNHQQTAWGINREHIWPKSHGFDNDDAATSGARGDPMHLWAGDGYVNREHNNNFYGYVDLNKKYKDLGAASGFEYAKGNYTGYSKTVGGSYTVFEPQDCDKGDIARSVFYMVARYNNLAGTDTNIDVDNPNLTLSDTIDMRTGTSTATDAYSLGIISDLLEWNKLDPVDEYEIRRNDILYRNFTNNRNPFIDFPQWADLIWGEEKGTSSADPTNDIVNNADDTIQVEGLKTTVKAGDEFTFKISIKDSTDPIEIKVSLADDSVASIEKVTAPVANKLQPRAAVKELTVQNGDSIKVKALKDGAIKLTIKATVGVQEHTLTKTTKVGDESAPKNEESILDKILKNPLYIGIAIGVVLLVVVIIIIFLVTANKKTKKKVGKTIKKSIKKSVKGSSGNRK